MAGTLEGILASIQGSLSTTPSTSSLQGILRRIENSKLEDQRKAMMAEELLQIPFYSTDVGRISGGGNRTGQPAVLNSRGEGMYPSYARTLSVPNPLYQTASIMNTRQPNLMPREIPADLAAILELMRQAGRR